MWISEHRLKRIEEKLEKLEKDTNNPDSIILNHGAYDGFGGYLGREEITVKDTVEKILTYLKLEFKVSPEKSKEYNLIKTKKK
jgi:hypothetical protein